MPCSGVWSGSEHLLHVPLVCVFVCVAPLQDPIAPFRPEGFTKWFKIVIREGDITLGRFLDIIQERYGIDVMIIESDLATQMGVLMPMYNGVGKKDRLLTEIVTEKLATTTPPVHVVTPDVRAPQAVRARSGLCVAR